MSLISRARKEILGCVHPVHLPCPVADIVCCSSNQRCLVVSHTSSLGITHPRLTIVTMAGDKTFIYVTIIAVAILFMVVFFYVWTRSRTNRKSKSQLSQPRSATTLDTEAHGLNNTSATHLPLYRIAEAHSVMQSVGGKVVLTMQGGSASEGVRAQQVRALARYENQLPLSSSSPRDPRPPAVIAQERRALERHPRSDTPSISSASHLLAPLPSSSLFSSLGVSACATATSPANHGGNDQEQNNDRDPDLRAQVRQLQEEVEHLRTEGAAPLQELPPAYQFDVASSR
jgi:hypothetical protein